MEVIKEWERYEKSTKHSSLDVRYIVALTKDTVEWGHIDYYDRGGFSEVTHQEVLENQELRAWIVTKMGRDVLDELMQLIRQNK